MRVSVMKHQYLLTTLILFSPLISAQEPFQSRVDAIKNLIAQKEYHQAITHLHTVMTDQNVNNPSDIFALGVLFTEAGDLMAALHLFKKTLCLLPNHTVPLYNVAYVLKLLGNSDASLAFYNRIIESDPAHEAAHLGRAFTYLQKGDFVKGWDAHAFNLKRQGKYAQELRQLLADDALKGKRILLLPEGGLGDSIQFIRYAKRLHDKGAYIIVALQDPLHPLFAACPYINELISLRVPRPAHDASATLMSLAAAFNDMPETFAADMPYVQADAHLVEQWQLKTGADRTFKVGLCWQCDVHNDVSRLPIARRGIPLEVFAPLMHDKKISWYSLQKKEGLDQMTALGEHGNFITLDNFDEEHGAFMDSAALIEALDLVITIDSAVAHLAGALGKEVWLLLPYVTDWRWIQGLSYSPWYPSMTIFKQNVPFDWESVIAEVAVALERKVAAHGESHTINTEVSIGEFLDKISILNIKSKRIKDKKKLKNVRTELATLYITKEKHIQQNSVIDILEQNLFDVNSKLWEIEDKIRDKEFAQQFDDEFVQLARSVYMTNEERMAIKQKLNQICGSRLVEEKSYHNYSRK